MSQRLWRTSRNKSPSGEVYRVEIIDVEGYKQKGDGMRLAAVVSNNQQNEKKKWKLD